MINSTLRDKDSNLKGINLQLFADKGETDQDQKDPETKDQDTGTDQDQQKDQGKQKTYTQEEVDKLLQQEADRRVSSARKKFEEEFRKKLEKEIQQAEELAKLSAEDRKQKELELEREKFEKERAEFQREKLKLQTIKDMNQRKLPIEFSEMVMGSNAEETLKNIKIFEQQWSAALEEAVKNRLKGRDYKSGNGQQDQDTDPFLKGFNSI